MSLLRHVYSLYQDFSAHVVCRTQLGNPVLADLQTRARERIPRAVYMLVILNVRKVLDYNISLYAFAGVFVAVAMNRLLGLYRTGMNRVEAFVQRTDGSFSVHCVIATYGSSPLGATSSRA